jgi:acyl carrier protein phosphodiesterase
LEVAEMFINSQIINGQAAPHLNPLSLVMNFLAHLYLSGIKPKIMLGNFVGDFIKGKSALEKFEPDIITGIELHRAIDEFTDRHPIVTESKKRLRPKYRHYSGVIVDIFYDHLLAKNWNTFHPDLLPDFADKAYGIIQSHDAILPEEVKFMMPHMIRGNWLVNYAKIEGIGKALSGMARRTRYESKMEQSVEDLIEYYSEFTNEFFQFFPDLKQHTEQFLREKGI